ncbi:MAG: T9SS type A sorting domain-containing protein, partial [Flavobacteriales bacterium]
CDNIVDDDCDGSIDEYCSTLVGNDSPSYATLVQYSVNSNYPNCYPIQGSLIGATASPESAAYSGVDRWYRFTAQSTGISITVSSTAQDDVIELYQKVGSVYTLMVGGVENAVSGAGDFERLNFNGLTPGQTYYVSIGAASGSTGGAYTLCIQHLMPSGCAYVQPAGGFGLCSSYKAIYRGAISNGVSYAFNFQGVGGGATSNTSLSGTNGLIVLSNPTLALRYSGIYDVRVDVNYALTNGASAVEPIVVQGSISSANCNDVTISAHPLMEVRSSQRCPATLLRSNWLIATTTGAGSQVCGAINYTYEFTQVVSCTDLTSVSVLPSEFTTGGTTPYLGLGVLPSLPQAGAWKVRVRPNFAYGSGVYGPYQTIQVANTAASGMLSESGLIEGEERTSILSSDDVIYPNPSRGDQVGVQFMNLQSEQVCVRILDAMGREVFNRNYSIDGSLNTTITFDQSLSAGVYTVQLQDGAALYTERMVVTK